jgi:hypothetical protein
MINRTAEIIKNDCPMDGLGEKNYKEAYRDRNI